jgi:hypothetical protein
MLIAVLPVGRLAVYLRRSRVVYSRLSPIQIQYKPTPNRVNTRWSLHRNTNLFRTWVPEMKDRDQNKNKTGAWRVYDADEDDRDNRS